MSTTPSREEEIFSRALLQPAGRGRAFIEAECRDDAALRARLLALLAAHAGPESLLVSAPVVRTVVPEEKSGDTIGRYKLLQKIGEGGCGVVWMAEQEEPVRRRVALKVIKVGMDTKAVIARFEAERQALAMMDHPHIAKVLDGGATDAGRPYFVMELVQGVPLTRFCDEHRLGPRARLELFVQICQAIQHAHQKGIIHRDIKPSNVLVRLHDNIVVPAVIDFGIAKATQGRLTDATLFTAFDQVLGTPVYMSPEQAEYNGLDVDTRSDIYSLGVVLYELLTGRTPFDPKSIHQSGLDEFRRMIRDVEPPRPSNRVRTLGDEEQQTVAARRSINPAQLPALLRGDLDWIVMKALEKNRTRRYQTANAFAMDVQRYLANEPVTARPPGTLYRSGKFVQRHRVAVTAAATVVLALVAGIIASTLQAVRATRAEQAANVERKRAVDARDRADHLVDFLIGEFRTELEKVGKLNLLDRVGDRAIAYFASFDAADLGDTALAQQAKALTQIGETRLQQGRYEEARQAFASALERAGSLAARYPRNGDLLFDRAQAEYWIGLVHRKRGDFAGTKEWWARYRDTAAALVAMEPNRQKWQLELSSGLHNLAVLKMESRDLKGARDDFIAKLERLRAMVAAAPNDLDLQYRVTNTQSWLGSLAERRGNFAEAVDWFAAEAQGLAAIRIADPATARWRFEQADSLSFQAAILSVTGKTAAAHAKLTEAQKLAEALVAHDPANREWHLSLLRLKLREAALQLAAGRAADALRIAEAVRTELEKTRDSMSADRSVRAHLVMAWKIEAEIREAMHRPDAHVAAERAIETGESLRGPGEPSEGIITELARAYVVGATIAARNDAGDQGKRYARHAWALLEPRLSDSNDWRFLDPAARSLSILGRHAESRAIIDRLHRLGYVPLSAWPHLSPTFSSGNQ